MGTRFPLGISISSQPGRFVSARASKVRYRKTAPGGFHSASMKLELDPADLRGLSTADQIVISGPTGRTLWEGFADNPRRSQGPEGITLDLSAMGTTVLAGDRSEALIYADRDLGQWEAYQRSKANASASTAADPSATDTAAADGLLVQFNRQVVSPQDVAQIGYTGFAGTTFEAGSVYAVVRSGKADSAYRNQIAYSGAGSGSIDSNIAIGTGAVATGAYVGTFPAGTKAVALRMRRTGAATSVADDNTWTWFSDVVVLGRRMNRRGELLTGLAGMQTHTHVRADWIVEDMLGRLLTFCDKTLSTVEAATFLIDQLAYLDGATAADVLDELALYEADFLWEILHHTGAGDLFNYRAWPTEARYEISVRDGYDAPGADYDLCNRILVRWTDKKGNPQVTVVTAATTLGTSVGGVPATVASPALANLEAQGRIRDAEAITLPQGRGSAANALRVGQQELALRADMPKSATAVIRRPIIDLLRGGYAMPYEIEPGYLVRVRETGDLLRLTEVEVDDEAGEAVLMLGTPQLTTEQRIARLAKVA